MRGFKDGGANLFFIAATFALVWKQFGFLPALTVLTFTMIRR